MTASPQVRLIYSASERDATFIEKRGKRSRVMSDLELDRPKEQARFEFTTGMIDGRIRGYVDGTGHGLGFDIHKAPGINSRNHTILKTGHVVTVEPGLYYPGMGGVRLEDVVLLTKTGNRNLVGVPKILEV